MLTSENFLFPNFFRGYRNEALGVNLAKYYNVTHRDIKPLSLNQHINEH